MCAHVASYATNAAGDFSMATFWLEMYRAQLPLARARVKQLYGHAGGVFSETSYVWVSIHGIATHTDTWRDGLTLDLYNALARLQRPV